MSPTFSEVSSKALGWLASHLQKFVPRQNRRTPMVREVKALAELLLIAELAPNTYREHPVILQIIDIASTVWSDPLYRARAVRHPRQFRIYFAPLATLARCERGLLTEDVAIIDQVLGAGYAQQVAEVPFQEMDVDWTLTRLGCSRTQSTSETVAQLVSRSLIGRHLPAVEFTREDTYNFTHLVFYITDWGRLNWPLDDSLLEYVRTTVAQLLAIWTHREDWDLVGELLIVASATNVLLTQPAQRAAERFISAQLVNGAFPLRSNAKPDFWNSYHTALVAVVLDMVVYHSKHGQSASISGNGNGVDLGAEKLFAEGLDRCRKLVSSDKKHERFAGLAKELLEDIPHPQFVMKQIGQVSSQSMNAVSYWPLLEAITNNDLVAIGVNLALGQAKIPPAVGFGVMSWLFSRQAMDGHFGSLEPERYALKKYRGRSIDFDTEVQWPSTLAVLAGISGYMNSF